MYQLKHHSEGINTYLELVSICNNLGSAVVNSHRTLDEAMLFFKGRIHHENRLARFLGTFLQGLLEQVTTPFYFRSTLKQSLSYLPHGMRYMALT